MDIWRLVTEENGVEYFKDLEALSLWIAAFDAEKVGAFSVEKIWVND